MVNRFYLQVLVVNLCYVNCLLLTGVVIVRVFSGKAESIGKMIVLGKLRTVKKR